MKIIYIIASFFLTYHACSQNEDLMFIEFKNFANQEKAISIDVHKLKKPRMPIVFLDSFSMENLKNHSIYKIDQDIASSFFKKDIFSLKNDISFEEVEFYILGEKHYHFKPALNINSYYVVLFVRDFENIEYFYKGIYSLNFIENELKSIVLLASIIADYELGFSRTTSKLKYETHEKIVFEGKMIVDHTHDIPQEIVKNSFIINKNGFIEILKR